MISLEHLIDSFVYNREDSYMIKLMKNIIYKLENSSLFYDEVDKDDFNLIYGAIILQYGEYGTSPSSGWIDDIKVRNDIIVRLNILINERRIVINMNTDV